VWVLKFMIKKQIKIVVEKKTKQGHKAIEALAAQYDVWVLTQNVDGFHSKAGSKQV
jgi:NAD-dependent SIR2 family protein deacetylase